MRAAFIDRLGPAESITVGDLPDPVPGPTDVLVRVAYTAVNPVDTYVRSGLYPTPIPFPFVVGRDLVGTVLTAGPGTAARFQPGERVWCNSLGHDGRQGAAAELAVVPADRLYRLPVNADPVEVAAAVHPAATAHLGLRRAGATAGDTILVGGGAGNVGRCVVQLSAAAGLRVIATARPADHGRCRDLGAGTVLDYGDTDLPARIREIAPDGVDIYWDTSGRADPSGAIASTAVRGRVVVSASRGDDPVIPMRALYMRDQQIIGFVISLATTADLAAAARDLDPWLASGRLSVRVGDAVALDDVPDAHARAERGTPGRIVIAVNPW
jgi:NADPH:quinone reductase-like Zn-dependent oxidoreductase